MTTFFSGNYKMTQINGERQYGPPSDWLGEAPKHSEIFISKLPEDCQPEELYHYCSQIGPVYSIRFMLNALNDCRGFAFVIYANEEYASLAAKVLPCKRMRRCVQPKVMPSLNVTSILLTGINPALTWESIQIEIITNTDMNNVKNVTPGRCDDGYWYVSMEFTAHKWAAKCARTLTAHCKAVLGAHFNAKLWNQKDFINPPKELKPIGAEKQSREFAEFLRIQANRKNCSRRGFASNFGPSVVAEPARLPLLAPKETLDSLNKYLDELLLSDNHQRGCLNDDGKGKATGNGESVATASRDKEWLKKLEKLMWPEECAKMMINGGKYGEGRRRPFGPAGGNNESISSPRTHSGYVFELPDAMAAAISQQSSMSSGGSAASPQPNWNINGGGNALVRADFAMLDNPDVFNLVRKLLNLQRYIFNMRQ